MTTKPLDHKSALELRFDSDAGENETIRNYLYALLSTLWQEEERFSGKRPFGNSGWEHDLYRPLALAGYVDGDSHGYVEYGPKRDHAKRVVHDLIFFSLYGFPQPKA